MFMVYGMLILVACVWAIKGCQMRWSHAAEVCAGDLRNEQQTGSDAYLISTGAFIKAYLTTFVFMVGLVFCVGCLGCCSLVVAMYRFKEEFGLSFMRQRPGQAN